MFCTRPDLDPEGYSRRTKVTRVVVGKFREPAPYIKGTRILFYGHVPNSFPPLKGANSTTTNYITGTANLITVVKITFELFLLKDFGNYCRKSLS